MKSDPIFCRLVSIDTLFAFNGIVLSAAELQFRLASLIELLNKALLAEHEAQAESEALCRALCCYFDLRLANVQQSPSFSWQQHSLVHYFYGYNESDSSLDLSPQLATLLRSRSSTIFRYAWKLLILRLQIEGQRETLIALRTENRARYLSRMRTYQPQPEPASWLAQSTAPGGTLRMMVFIIGPFAGKWFHQSTLAADSDGDIVWVVVEHASSLVKRLAYLRKNYDTMSTLAFFPLLADGFENNSVMVEQIAAWQEAFSSASLTQPLPCMLGIYTQLSQERYTPDQTNWSGGLTAPQNEYQDLKSQLFNLIDDLDACDASNELHAIQRHALSSTLVAWLAERGILNVLQSLFNFTPLSLKGVTLADQGSGFPRHGAWSQWLAQRYAVVPGLSTTVSALPLPVITLPPRKAPEDAQPTSQPRRRWAKMAASLAQLATRASRLFLRRR